MDAVQQIKDKLSIEDIVSQYVQLKKAGVNYKGLCPWHQEKTPSFMVSPEKQIAYCFSCHKGGDLFTFIQEIEGIDFNDALKLLAERAGIKLERAGEKQQFATGDTKNKMFDICTQAADFYHQNLNETGEGKKVEQYLINRGLNKDSIKRFKIGYAPDSFDTTYNFLINKGFSKRDIVASGLAVAKDTTAERIYDRFRGRLMFPIFDHAGRVVAFGGRALSKEQEPKYLNSPETQVYHKSRILYGYSHAKASIKEKSEVVVAEGYMDVVASAQAGVKNIVAPCGTALGINQIRILKPFIKSIVFSFDSDLAGREAARRAFEVVKELDVEVKMLELPEGKDPAEYVKLHGNDFQNVVADSKLYVDYIYNHLIKSYGTDGHSAKKKVLHEFLPFFSGLNSNVEKDAVVRKLAMDLGLREVQIYDEMRNFNLPEYHPARRDNSEDEVDGLQKSNSRTTDEHLMGLMIEYPRIGRLYLDKITDNYFSEKIKPIYKVYNGYYNNVGSESVESVLSKMPAELKEKASLLSMYVSEVYGEKPEREVEKSISELIGRLRKAFITGNIKKLQSRLKEAEEAGDNEAVKQIITELSKVNSEIAE